MIDGDCRVKGILLAAISIVAFIVVFLYNTQPLFQSNGKILREFQKKIEVAFRVQSLDSYPHASSCQALFRTADQYTVRIDNETYPKSVPLFYNSSINFECLNQNQKKPLILFWNEFFSDPYYSYKNNSFENNGCPVTNCETTVDKKRYDEASLVVTHMRNSFDLQEFPKYRPDYLRTVFLLYESPYHSPDFTQYNGFYNMTSTYKLDSDFAHFYEDGMRWKKNANFKKSFDFHGQKKGMAAALISNCNDRSGRLEYIKKLSEHMRVDIYGNCGDKKCPETFANGTKGNCRAILAEEYKFFLAFENSICDGYITEKFFSTLRYNTIPVVHGGGHYEQLVSERIFSFFVDALFIDY